MPERQIAEPTNARSRRTRAALLDATRAILESEGFEALTMSAIATRAGVSRGAAYLHFASRSDLVAALMAHVAETEGLRDSVARVWAAPDAVAALDEWGRHLAEYHPRVLAVARAVDRVRDTDSDAAAHHSRVVEAQLANCRRLASWLADEGRLAAPWTTATATDMLWALISTDMIEGLLVERAWPVHRLRRHLQTLLRATFVTGGGDR
jgi:AcrR family transcriptional regulator